MYINDVHIFTYIIFFIVGAIVGQFIEWVNKRVLEDKKIFSKDIKLELKKKLKINYFSVISTAILYVIVLYKFGIKSNILGNLNLIKYIVLIPILISIMIIDYKKRIIPNRLTFTIFESGIIFTFLYGIDNLFLARDYLLGMIVGLAVFAVIAILGRIIAGKEAMGLRRCETNCNFRFVFWYSINYINSYNVICYCRCYKCNYNNIQKEKKYKKRRIHKLWTLHNNGYYYLYYISREDNSVFAINHIYTWKGKRIIYYWLYEIYKKEKFLGYITKYKKF